MSIISQKFPIISDTVNGLTVLMVSMVVILQFWFFQESVELPKLIVWYILTGIILVIIAIRYKDWKINLPKPIIIMLLVWLGLITLSTIFSLDTQNSFFGIYPRYTSSWVFFISWLVFILVLAVQNKRIMESLIRLSALLGVLMAVWGILQFYGIGFYAGQSEVVRTLIPSFLGNPSFSSMFIVASLPLLLWYKGMNGKIWTKYVYIISIALVFLSLIYFNSRGAIVAVASSLLIYVALNAFKAKKFNNKILALGLIVFMAVAGAFYYQTRVDIGGKESGYAQQASSSRLILWDLTVSQIGQMPLFGTGFGNFFLAFRENTHPIFSSSEWFDDAHNFVLQFYTTTGVLAGTVFMLLLAYTFFTLFKSYLNREDYHLQVALMSALLAWCVAGFFTPVPLANWMLLAILLMASWRLTSEHSIVIQPKVYYRAAGIILGLLVCTIGISIMSSEIFLRIAKESETQSQSEKAYKYSSLALKANPFNTDSYIVKINSELQLGNIDKVDQELARFIAKHPKSSGIYQLAADFNMRLYVKTGDEEYRQRTFGNIENMLKFNSNYASVYRTSALLSFYLNDVDKSMTYINRSLVLDINSYNSWILKSKINYDSNNKDQMLYALKRANAIAPRVNVGNAIKSMQKTDDYKLVPFPYQF